MNLSWVTIQVENLEKSKDFYGNYLNMELEREFSPSEELKIAFFADQNGTKVELIQTKNAPKRYTGISLGLHTSQYELLLEKARSMHILSAEPTVLGGNVECFFVEDPSGVGIQIIKA